MAAPFSLVTPWPPAGGGTGGAPDDAEYLVATAAVDLTAERVATSTATVAWDTGTAGQIKANVPDDAITNAKLRDSAALSVIGRSANSSGDPADIAGATVGHVLQVAAGPTLAFGTHRRPSVNNPPATTHIYSDEFDATTLDGKWTPISSGTTNPIALATVDRLNSLTTPIYDPATMPSYMLFQSDNSAVGTFGIKQSVSLGGNATIFTKMFADNRVFNAASEGSILLTVFNSADTNEYVQVGLGNNAGGGQTTRAVVSNNGVLALNFVGGTRVEGNPLIESLFCIMKAANVYYFFSGTEGTPLLTLLGSATKSGVTALDTMKIECTAANETPSTVYGVDFVRWYDSQATNLVNV